MRKISIEELLAANEAHETARARNVEPTFALLLAACAAGATARLTLEQIQQLAAEAFDHVTRLAEDVTSPG